MESCNSISLRQICNNIRFIYLSKHLKNIRKYYLPDIQDLKTQVEIITEEVIHFLQENRKQQKTLNNFDNVLNSYVMEM